VLKIEGYAQVLVAPYRVFCHTLDEMMRHACKFEVRFSSAFAVGELHCWWFLPNLNERLLCVLSFKALHSSTTSMFGFKTHFRYSLFFVGPGMLLLNTKWFFYKLREWRYLMELIHLTSRLVRLGL